MSTYEYNFEIKNMLDQNNYITFTLYDNQTRSLLDIHEKKIISKFNKLNHEKII